MIFYENPHRNYSCIDRAKYLKGLARVARIKAGACITCAGTGVHIWPTGITIGGGRPDYVSRWSIPRRCCKQGDDGRTIYADHRFSVGAPDAVTHLGACRIVFLDKRRKEDKFSILMVDFHGNPIDPHHAYDDAMRGLQENEIQSPDGDYLVVARPVVKLSHERWSNMWGCPEEIAVA